jgi:hypothetical protein
MKSKRKRKRQGKDAGAYVELPSGDMIYSDMFRPGMLWVAVFELICDGIKFGKHLITQARDRARSRQAAKES